MLKKKRPQPRRFSGLWFVKKITLLVILSGIALFLYAGGTFGYSYYQAKVGQGELRSLFGITGNGSVDSGYINGEADAMASSIDYLDPVGEISIPGIDCRWMIVEGSDDAALTKGPGHIEETQFPGMGGNFVVAGDRVLYGAPFLHLDEVAAGDRITVKMPYATFVYKVRESFIVTPDDVSVLQPPGYEAITLLTCDPPWDIKQRIVIRGELEEVLPAGTDI
jgi:sortase A